MEQSLGQSLGQLDKKFDKQNDKRIGQQQVSQLKL
jgi:hypothetical protein